MRICPWYSFDHTWHTRPNAMRPELPPITPNPVIEAYKKDVDRTLLGENLKLSVEERFLKHMQFQRFAEELRRAGAKASSNHS